MSEQIDVSEVGGIRTCLRWLAAGRDRAMRRMAGLARSSDPGDAVVGRILSTLLVRSHLMAPGSLADYLKEAARPLGVSEARIYLADLQQKRLRLIPDGSERVPESLAVESTPAGLAFQTITIQHAETERDDQGHRLWIPLVEGVERLGVLELCFAPEATVTDVPGQRAGKRLSEATLESCRVLASLVGLLITSKGTYSDAYTEIQRSRAMALQAEMVWAFLAPRTFATSEVLFAAALEPAYEVGGDAYDHSLIDDHLQVSIFDSVGHDLTAGLISSVAMASCRTTRRTGGDLTDIAVQADRAIAGEFGASRFATALLCDLDIGTGEFTWLPCGHPPPVLIRDNRVVTELIRQPCLPLGLGQLDARPAGRGRDDDIALAGGYDSAYTEQLQAGDRILLYTDGVIEGRGEDGRQFTLARLGEVIVGHIADGLSAPEILRCINRSILEHQRGRLTDDATMILLEWLPAHPEHQLTL
jgi:Stage II sporulation protein E (SpoIIE)